MVAIAQTAAKWWGAPGPLFCAPKSIIPEAPRWDFNGWCPNSGTTWDQPQKWAAPFGSKSRGDIHYGPGAATANVPPEVLAEKATYLDYVKSSVAAGGPTGGNCLVKGECCMDVPNQRAGSWKSCAGGCPNAANPDLVLGGEARTDVEGCCWWGRGAIQTTGICNFGKLNYFIGAKAAKRGKQASTQTWTSAKTLRSSAAPTARPT